jgi:tRNA uridine 5-carboxymethylaminomethyl modification enzyme
MFTSRAEYRLILREDNADLRLTTKARELGLVDDERWVAFETKQNAIDQEKQRLRSTLIRPDNVSTELAMEVFGQPFTKEAKLDDLIKRPDVTYAAAMRLPGAGEGVSDEKVAEQVEIQLKYAGYIDRQKTEIERNRRYDDLKIPESMDYDQVQGLSSEIRQKLGQHNPATLGQASRISGVTPAAISLILVHLKKRGYLEKKTA